jgi:hypothetical protein
VPEALSTVRAISLPRDDAHFAASDKTPVRETWREEVVRRLQEDAAVGDEQLATRSRASHLKGVAVNVTLIGLLLVSVVALVGFFVFGAAEEVWITSAWLFGLVITLIVVDRIRQS